MAADQTPREWIRDFGEGSTGTAVLLRLGVSGSTTVTFRRDLTYADCVSLGEAFEAFKWIPAEVATYAAVVGSRCRIPGEPCVESCDAYGCICNPAAGQCVDANGNARDPFSGAGTGNLQWTPDKVFEVS